MYLRSLDSGALEGARMNWPEKNRCLQTLCSGRAVKAAGSCFPLTLWPPGPLCWLDIPAISPSSPSSTVSHCFPALMHLPGFSVLFSSCHSFPTLVILKEHFFVLGTVSLAMNFQEPREAVLSSKYISLSEGLTPCTVMGRIKSATHTLKKKIKRKKKRKKKSPH